jgi:hypothetical protein
MLQIARIDAISGRDDSAAALFLAALECAAEGQEPHLRSVVWHYIGAWCVRRELWVAALLAYQEAVDVLPEDEHDARLDELGNQLVPLDRLGEWPALLATIRILEDAGAPPDPAEVPPIQQIVDQLGLPADGRSALLRVLDAPAGPSTLRTRLLARARAALPDFISRFGAGELELEDTVTAVLPADAAAASQDSPLDRALEELNDAGELAAAWEPGAEDAMRTALTHLEDADGGLGLGYGWNTVGAYFLDRAQPAAALLAYAAALRLAEAAAADDQRREIVIDGALYGSAYALASLHETHAQLACIALLERRGALGILPTTAQLLAGQSLSPGQLRRLHARLLDDDARCRAKLDAAVRSARRGLPDFEQRFRSGTERFDTPERVLTIIREPTRNPRRRETSADRVRQLYRSRLVRRVLGAVAMTAGSVAVLLVAGALSWAWPFQLLGFAAVALVAAIGIQRARHILGWVRATNLTDLDRATATIEQQTSTHRQAYAVLERCFRDRAPFALYLRSFETEGAEWVAANSRPVRDQEADRLRDAVLSGQSPAAVAAGFTGAPQNLISVGGGRSEVDAYLADRLGARLPVVAVLNPAALPTAGSQVPRLELGHDDWAIAIVMLISAASLIVMECTVLGAGVLEELQFIVNRERTARTVIVLPSAATVRDAQSKRDVVSILQNGAIVSLPPFASRDAEPLAPFERVIDADALLAADPAELPVFQGLLPEAGPSRLT